MSTLTSRLQLKRPDGSDPFQRSDYVDALNKLDAAPGVHPCTSTSRPTWGAAQAGRTILETDTRTEYTWSGTAWLPVLTAPSAWHLAIGPNSWQGPGTIVTHNMGTITTSRPGLLMVSMVGAFSCLDTSQQYHSLQIFIDGVLAGGGSNGHGYIQWTGSNNNGSNTDVRMSTAHGYKSVAPGAHTIAARSITSTAGGLSVGTVRVSAEAILTNDVAR